MREIKAPENYDHNPKDLTLFLAGGITNCAQWQEEAVAGLTETEIVILNPRRDHFDISNRVMEEDQIKWEHHHIMRSKMYLFWFCEETVCPITLFELGKVAGLFPKKPIFVGTHPGYSRKRDINFQMLLLRPEVNVVTSLERLVKEVIDWAKHYSQRHVFS